MQQAITQINYASIQSVTSEFFNSIQVKPTTFTAYNKGINFFIDWAKGQNLTSVTKNDIINYMNHLQAKGLKPTTINNYIAGLRAFYKFLEIEKDIKDITKGVKTPKLNKEFKKDALTPAQVNLLLDNVKDQRDKIILLLGISCGLRTVEIARLDRADLQVKAGRPVLYVLGKGKSEKQAIVIPDELYNQILTYLSTRTDTHPALIFATSNRSTGRLNSMSISRIIKHHFKNIGLNSDRLTAHSLRHTAITFSLLSGNSLRETQDLARHSDIKTTMIYAHDINRMQAQTTNNIMNFIKTNK